MVRLKEMENIKNQTILFFDGDCGLCHWACKYVEGIDSEGLIAFAPLNGKTYALILLERLGMARLDTIIFFHEGELFFKFQAIVKITEITKPNKIWPKLAKYIPLSLGNCLYELVAKNRKYLFCSLRDLSGRQYLD